MKSYNKFLLTLVIGLFFITSEAKALWPTLDISSIKESITNTVEQVKQSKFVMDATATAGKMSAAIGDAKASVSKFAGDKIKDAKEKAEKLKAEKEKIEEKKRELEEKKREIEEKKAEMEDYKRKAEEAKKSATDKISEAKSTVADAKEVAGSAGDIANAKLNSATGGAVSLPSGGGSSAGESSSTGGAYDDSYDSYAPTSSAKDYGGDAALSAEPTEEDMAEEQGLAPEEEAEEDIVIDDSGDTLFDDAKAPVTPAAPETTENTVANTVENVSETPSVATPVAKAETPKTAPTKRFRESPTVKPATMNAPVASSDAVVSDRFRDTTGVAPRVEAVSAPIAEQEVSRFRTKDTSAREAVQEQLKAIPATAPAKAPANSGFRKRPQLNKTLNTSSLFYRNSTPLVFAQGVVSLEEGDFIAEGDHEGKFIFAVKLSEECKILPTDLSDSKAMNDCLKKLLCCMHSSDRAKSEDCKATYSIIVMQTNKALAAEALKLKLDSASYKLQVAVPQADDMASASQVRDDLNNIAQTTSQQQMLLNTMASSLSSQLSNEALARFPGMDKAAFVGYCEE